MSDRDDVLRLEILLEILAPGKALWRPLSARPVAHDERVPTGAVRCDAVFVDLEKRERESTKEERERE